MYYYSLKIITQSYVTAKKVHEILGIREAVVDKHIWEYIIKETEDDPPVSFVDIFLDCLQNKYNKLKEIGIQRNNITVWMNYEYDSQCNMEFDPKQLKRLGDEGIKLCITCWEKKDT